MVNMFFFLPFILPSSLTYEKEKKYMALEALSAFMYTCFFLPFCFFSIYIKILHFSSAGNLNDLYKRLRLKDLQWQR